MRFIAPEKDKPGDAMIATWFAYFPVTIGRETRWWETVSVRFEYEYGSDGGWHTEGWVKKEFVEGDK